MLLSLTTNSIVATKVVVRDKMYGRPRTRRFYGYRPYGFKRRTFRTRRGRRW